MGGSFSISYNSVAKIYNLFQDSLERLYFKTSKHARNFDWNIIKKYLSKFVLRFGEDSDLEEFRWYNL